MMSNLKGATQEDIDHGEEEIFVDFRNSTTGEMIFKVRNLVQTNESVRKRV